MRKIAIYSVLMTVGLVLATAARCAETAASAGGGLGRIGVGVNLGHADVRYELGARNAVGVVVKFRSISGKDLQADLLAAQFPVRDASDRYGTGAYFMHRMTLPDPAGWHLIGGFDYTQDDACGAKLLDFSLYGGAGFEYFLPGTKQVSLEASIGMGLHFLKTQFTGAASHTATQMGFEPLLGGLTLRLYIN
jgi:hypothetical protein